jgi:hypothetical protein
MFLVCLITEKHKIEPDLTYYHYFLSKKGIGIVRTVSGIMTAVTSWQMFACDANGIIAAMGSRHEWYHHYIGIVVRIWGKPHTCYLLSLLDLL